MAPRPLSSTIGAFVAAAWACTALACSSTSETAAPANAGPDAGEENDAASEVDAPAGPTSRACYLDESAAAESATGGFRAPTKKYAGLCSKKTIEDLLFCTHLSDEAAPKDPHCQALVPEKTCLSCLFSTRGAILDQKFPNVAGCIALALGETTTTGCAAAYSDWDVCRKAGCASCIGKSIPDGDLNACTHEAAEKVCDARSHFERCAGLDGNADYHRICEPDPGPSDAYLGRLYNYFCGTEGAF